MSVLTQSVIDRVVYVTNDPQFKLFRLTAIRRWMNEGAQLIAEVAPRAAAGRHDFTLAEGAQQDLRTDTSKRWIRLHEALFNLTSTDAEGDHIRLVDPRSLNTAFRAWRRRAPAPSVFEYALDERTPFTFDVFPPVRAGAKIRVVASVAPPDFCVLNTGGTALADPTETIPLTDGFDIPLVDWVLYRLFTKDTTDQAYAARANNHRQAAQGALGVVIKDAA